MVSHIGLERARERLQELPAKRRAFVTAYLGEAKRNATAAARIAGYADPPGEASRLLADEKVASVIEAMMAATESASVLSYLEACIILSDIARGVPQAQVTDLAGEPTGKLAAPTIRERIAAIVELSKLRGYDSPQRHEFTVTSGEAMPVDEAKKVVLLHRATEQAKQ